MFYRGEIMKAIFIREESYAAVRGQGRPMKKKGGDGKQQRGPAKWSLADIIAELLRLEGGSALMHFGADAGRDHAPPVFVDGVGYSADKLQQWHAELLQKAAEAKVERSGKMQKQWADTPILLSVVASYPSASAPPVDPEATSDQRRAAHAELVKSRLEIIKQPEFTNWRDLTVGWAQMRYGAERIAYAVIHLDETEIHLHIGADAEGYSVRPLMAGASAALAVAKARGTRKEQQTANNKGKAELLDSYQREVGEPCGLARTGPTPRKRMSSTDLKKAKTKALCDELERRAHEEARRLAKAAEAEAKAVVATARARAAKEVKGQMAQAKEDMRAAHKLYEADRARKREAELEEIQKLHAREEGWKALLAELTPDPSERARALSRFGLAASTSKQSLRA